MAAAAALSWTSPRDVDGASEPVREAKDTKPHKQWPETGMERQRSIPVGFFEIAADGDKSPQRFYSTVLLSGMQRMAATSVRPIRGNFVKVTLDANKIPLIRTGECVRVCVLCVYVCARLGAGSSFNKCVIYG